MTNTSKSPRTDDAPIRVLVAEDEALIRLDLVDMLRDEGYEVIGEASDGEEALALARELNPDLVVMDVKMPKMDGITAAATIAEERIAAVVMLTAFSQRELIERAREAGAMAYVVKPFDASDVVPAIEIAMARFAEIRAVEAEVADLEERFASRKAVDQAKGLLQEGLGLTEPEAFRWIQKTAMDLRKSMREVAEGVIEHAKAGRPGKRRGSPEGAGPRQRDRCRSSASVGGPLQGHGDPRCADLASVVIGQGHVVGGQRAADPKRRGDPGYPARPHRQQVRGVDVDPGDLPLRPDLGRGGQGGEGLGHDAGGAAVPQPERLGVPLDRIAPHRPGRGDLVEDQPHLLVQGAGEVVEPVGHVHGDNLGTPGAATPGSPASAGPWVCRVCPRVREDRPRVRENRPRVRENRPRVREDRPRVPVRPWRRRWPPVMCRR